MLPVLPFLLRLSDQRAVCHPVDSHMHCLACLASSGWDAGHYNDEPSISLRAPGEDRCLLLHQREGYALEIKMMLSSHYNGVHAHAESDLDLTDMLSRVTLGAKCDV